MVDFSTASFRPHGPVSLGPTRDSGWVLACVTEPSAYEDTTLSDTIDAFKEMFSAKRTQWTALSEVVAAETALAKKSLIVTCVGLGGAFVLSCICWVIINAAIGVALDRAGLHLLVTTLILLALNGAIIAICVKAVLEGYKRITVMPIWRAITGQAGVDQSQDP